MSYIQKVSIPIQVSKISQSSFADCYKLKTVTFDDNSEISLIDEKAFYNTSIERISMPIHVIKIGDSVFYDCKKLKIGEIKKKFRINFYRVKIFIRKCN